MVPKYLARYVALTALAAIWALPVVAMLVFSFAPNTDIVLMKLWPSKLTLDNYIDVFTTRIRGVSVSQSLLNSAKVLVIQVVGIMLLDIPAAYALARLRFWGRELIFAIILVTMMMPGHIMLISLYDLMAKLGLVDTLAGVVLPGLPRVIGVFMLRQFFREIPDELEDAARIDGASEWLIFTHIMIPLALPALATLAVLTMLYSWNNFLWPLVITNTPTSMTAPIAMAYLRSGTNQAQNMATMLAAAIVTSLPMIIVFIFGQRWIVRSLSPTSGIK